MKLHITDYPYHQLYSTSHEKINLPKWDTINLNLPSPTEYKFNIPELIQTKILTTLFFSYLVDRDFSSAFLLTLTNKYYARHFHNLIYEPNVHHPIALSRRIGHTMAYCQSFDDNYITEIYYSDCTNYVISLMARSMTWQWPLVQPDIWELMSVAHIYDLNESQLQIFNLDHTHMFNTGPYIGDIVWAKGAYKNTTLKTFETDKLQHPVFTFQICDVADTLMFTENHPIPFSYHCFAKLLTYIYGPNTAVYFMVKPEQEYGNPFITYSNKLILI